MNTYIYRDIHTVMHEYIIQAGPPFRGVQYVHCVMHKCIMVKVERKRKTRKVCKIKHFNSTKSWGIKKFSETEGKCSVFVKTGIILNSVNGSNQNFSKKIGEIFQIQNHLKRGGI